ncbi:hypothetical protein WAB17_07000 [Parerythrobacter aurantius]|uniref:hypothetical protein n=1 Tax=Parerythrobacter aurantius TaxID=3127706 RepID=UPI003252995B
MTKASTVQRKGGNQPPISAHPLFPAIVALWFAALLGIGSLVVPDILLESTVDATGIAAIAPSLAPPLGFTAKLLLASVSAGLGAIIGLVLARKVVQSQAPAAPKRFGRRAAAREAGRPAKKPFVATEELGEEGLGKPHHVDDGEAGPATLPGRRRALSVTDDSGPSEYLAVVPLPGEDPYAPVSDDVTEGTASPEPDHFALADPANRRDGSNVVAEAEPATVEAPAETRPFDTPIAFPSPEATGGDGADYGFAAPAAAGEAAGEAIAWQPAQEDPMTARPFAMPAQRFAAAVPAAPAAPLADLSMSDLIARFAKSMQEHDARAEEPVPAVVATVSEGESEIAADAAAVPFAFARPFDAANEAEPAPEQPAFAAPAFAQAEASVPAALRPLDLGAFEEDDNDDPFGDSSPLAFGIPERMFEKSGNAAEENAPAVAAPVAASGAPGESPAGEHDAPGPFVPQTFAPQPFAFADPLAQAAEAGEDDDNEDAYSSLLSMKSPLGSQREFVRIEDEDGVDMPAAPEPVVVFPGHGTAPAAPAASPRPFDAPPSAFASSGMAAATPTYPAQKPADPAETERALREALEKLQRMSGAA